MKNVCLYEVITYFRLYLTAAKKKEKCNKNYEYELVRAGPILRKYILHMS